MFYIFLKAHINSNSFKTKIEDLNQYSLNDSVKFDPFFRELGVGQKGIYVKV